jgi:hypothetical protein
LFGGNKWQKAVVLNGEYAFSLCYAFSMWWSDGANDDIFIRTAGSGALRARATSRFKRGKNTESQFGDMTYNTPEGKPFIDMFSVEMKTGYGTKSKNKRRNSK